MLFLGKIQIQISESKNEFGVFWGKSKNRSWIHKIHTQGGFLETKGVRRPVSSMDYRRSAEREAVGLNPGRTNTQGL